MFFLGLFFLFLFLILHFRNYSKLYNSPVPKSYPSISILVPAYNEEKTIKSTLLSLIALKYPAGKKEIIILNDGSTDNTLNVAKQFAKKYSFIKILDKKNSGKANSLNAGLKLAKGELVAVVDADSYPEPNALLKMVGFFNEPCVAAVTSKVLVKNKNNWLSRIQVLDYSIIAWTRKLLDFIDSVYVTNGPLSVYRKNVLITIGGFDPKNLTEDIEITWNLLSKGYQTRMAYAATVYTSVPERFKEWVNQRVRWDLGGVQTIGKYWSSMFKSPMNMFSAFVIPYVSASFILAILGFLLFLRYAWITGGYNFYSMYYAFQGYNLFGHFEFSFYVTLLFILGITFLGLSLLYYKIGFKNSNAGKVGLYRIFTYLFIYRVLYTIPLILAIYRIARGDLRWYTK